MCLHFFHHGNVVVVWCYSCSSDLWQMRFDDTLSCHICRSRYVSSCMNKSESLCILRVFETAVVVVVVFQKNNSKKLRFQKGTCCSSSKTLWQEKGSKHQKRKLIVCRSCCEKISYVPLPPHHHLKTKKYKNLNMFFYQSICFSWSIIQQYFLFF